MIRRLINKFVEPYRKECGGLIVRPNDDSLWEQEMVEVKPEGQLWEDLLLVAFGILITGALVIFLVVCDPEHYALTYALLSLCVSVAAFHLGR